MKKIILKYSTFLNYLRVSVISFVIDITFFSVFNHLFVNQIIKNTIFARVISSTINYLLNKKQVFKSEESNIKTIIKYFSLVIIQMLISAFLVDNIYKIFKNINPTFIKIPIEFILFICNYLIQKILIFKKGGGKQ